MTTGSLEMQKARLVGRAFCELIGRRPTLPHTRACSTIGAERLNFRVRDGNGWGLLARVTQSAGRTGFCLRRRILVAFKEPVALWQLSI